MKWLTAPSVLGLFIRKDMTENRILKDPEFHNMDGVAPRRLQYDLIIKRTENGKRIPDWRLSAQRQHQTSSWPGMGLTNPSLSPG